MSFRRLPILLAAALTLLAAAAAPASAAPYFGFNDNSVLYGHKTADRAATDARGAGADSVRVTLDWRVVGHTRGQYDFSIYDRIYQAAGARGQRPLFILLFAPPWARGEGVCAGVDDCRAAPAPEHDGDWADFAAAVAKRYPRLAGIEVWNEPNLGVFWDGPVSPARYTELLKAAYTAIKRVAPKTPVIAGALSNYGGDSADGPGMGAGEFLDRMYAAGAKGFYDGISLHPYGHLNPWYGYRAIMQVKESRASHGDAAPLWFSEVSVTADGPWAVAADDQARWLGRVIPQMLRRPDVEGVYVHTLYTDPWWPEWSAEYGYAVIGPDGPKPGYCALAAALAKRLCSVPAPDSAQNARWDAQEVLQSAAEAAVALRGRSGDYSGLTAADLRLAGPNVRELTGDATPGPDADPSRVGVWPGADGRELLLCNSSRADRSYCIYRRGAGDWVYGAAAGSVYGTAGAVTTGVISWWW